MFHDRIIGTNKVSAGLCFKNGEVRLRKLLLDGLKCRIVEADDGEK